MDEPIVNEAEFEKLEETNDAPVEPEFAEIFPEEFKNEEISMEEPFEQNEVNTIMPEVKERLALSDKIADYLGIILSLLLMTAGAALTLAFFFTFIPEIKFTFLHFLKCWSGIVAGLFIRGILKTNI